MNFEELDNEKQVQVLSVALKNCAKQLEEAQTELHEMKEKAICSQNIITCLGCRQSFILAWLVLGLSLVDIS